MSPRPNTVTLDDFVIERFLHSCYGSLEKTKKCIELFCTYRCNMPEIFTKRDLLSKEIQNVLSHSRTTSYRAGENEICMYQYNYLNLEHFDFYAAYKTIQMQFDYWIENSTYLAEGQIFLGDIKHIQFKIITKINLSFMKRFIVFMLEAMPLRIKQIHLYNCPPYVDKLYALVKPILPQHIMELVYFHSDVLSLHKVIDKQYLPIECGGEAPSLEEQHEYWVKQLMIHRDAFLDDSKWKADLSKKNGKTNEDMNGSFRTLAID